MKMMDGLLTTDLAFLNQGVRELCLILSPVALFILLHGRHPLPYQHWITIH